MLTNWAIAYRLDPALVRALAWMESGYQPGLVSSSGARGVLQVLPSTRSYVQTVLIGNKVPRSTPGTSASASLPARAAAGVPRQPDARARGVVPGPGSVRKHGQLAGTRLFVANVLALLRRRM